MQKSGRTRRRGKKEGIEEEADEQAKKKRKKLFFDLDPTSFSLTSSCSLSLSLSLSTSPLPNNTNSLPDTAAACSSEWKIVKQTWARRQELPLSEAGLYAAFAGELFAWFCAGEILGRGGSISGYSV